MSRLRITRAGPLTTIQDEGRHGLLGFGISASGPMDRGSYRNAGLLGGSSDGAAIEFTRAGIDVVIVGGEMCVGWDGGTFTVHVNGEVLAWPGSVNLKVGDRLAVSPGATGNYGYLRFGAQLKLDPVLGSRSTSTRARIGGLGGRALQAGDELVFSGQGVATALASSGVNDGPIRFIWGLHADRFTPQVRDSFAGAEFVVTPAMDRMGVRLVDRTGVFAGSSILSLVSEPVVPGDIQILGDGMPIVLMRDHQPTGGYPRIGTVITADLDRFAQVRSGEKVVFMPVSVEHAHALMRSRP